MNRLVVACGLLVLETATHAVYAGTHESPGLWSFVLPGLLGASPAICKTANECFRLLTECGGEPMA
jgi:hypothetical protein